MSYPTSSVIQSRLMPPPVPKYIPTMKEVSQERANTDTLPEKLSKSEMSLTTVPGAFGTGGAPLNILPVKGIEVAALYSDNGSEYLPSTYIWDLRNEFGVAEIGGPVYGAIAVGGIGLNNKILTGYVRFLASDFGFKGDRRLYGASGEYWDYANLRTSGFNSTRNYTLGISATLPANDLISSIGYSAEFNNNNYSHSIILDENATPGTPDRDFQETGSSHNVYHHIAINSTGKRLTTSAILTVSSKGELIPMGTIEYAGPGDFPVNLALSIGGKGMVGASIGFPCLRFNGSHINNKERSDVTIQGQGGVKIE